MEPPPAEPRCALDNTRGRKRGVDGGEIAGRRMLAVRDCQKDMVDRLPDDDRLLQHVLRVARTSLCRGDEIVPFRPGEEACMPAPGHERGIG